MRIDNFLPIFIAVILASLAESLLSVFWVPFYMRLGIPILRKRFSVLTKDEFRKTVFKLNDKEMAGEWYSDILFKRISPDELAYRSRQFETRKGGLRFRFRSPVRGIVRLQEPYEVTIAGYIPWSTPLIFVMFIWIFSFLGDAEGNPGYNLLAIVLVVIVATTVLQIVMYRHIGTRIQAYFTENYRETRD
jgi:hypothetical protein